MTRLPDVGSLPFLEMRHVDVARGETVVLHDISLSIDAGEHVAILGPNGCGKSTLIKTITCECYPIVAPETSIRLLGRDRCDPAPQSLELGTGAPSGPRPRARVCSRRMSFLSGQPTQKRTAL